MLPASQGLSAEVADSRGGALAIWRAFGGCRAAERLCKGWGTGPTHVQTPRHRTLGTATGGVCGHVPHGPPRHSMAIGTAL